MPETKTYTIGELAEAAKVTTRTVRYYVSEGLLAAPTKGGRVATYTDEHLARLALIKLLKAEFLPLQEIRSLMAGLDYRAVLDLLAEKRQVEGPPQTASTAKEYLQTLLNPPSTPSERQNMMRHRLRAKQRPYETQSPPAGQSVTALPDEVTGSAAGTPGGDLRLGMAEAKSIAAEPEQEIVSPAPAGILKAKSKTTPTHWQRIEITPDVELHVREGLEKTGLWKKIEQLIKIARQLLSSMISVL